MQPSRYRGANSHNTKEGENAVIEQKCNCLSTNPLPSLVLEARDSRRVAQVVLLEGVQESR